MQALDTAGPGLRLEADGWLGTVRRCRSPNQDARPSGTTVNLLVVHAISLPPGCFGGPHVDRLFTNTLEPRAHPGLETLRGLRVSAHLLIARDGGVTQYVSLSRRAWHAGESVFEQRPRCNDYSIGVELEGDSQVSYAEVQYLRLVELSRLLMRAYPAISPERVVGHCHIAPKRKQDPYAHFDWDWYRARLRDRSRPPGARPPLPPGTRHGEPDRI